MLCLLPILAVAPTVRASGVSQIVLSCSTPPLESHNTDGCSSSELVTTPPIIGDGTLYVVGGFWIWCQNPNSGTPYGPDCSGSVYIEEVNIATSTGVYETNSISGTATGTTGLQVTFTSSDGDMLCTLHVPTSPTSGGTNTLSGYCDGIPITFSNAVVQVT